MSEPGASRQIYSGMVGVRLAVKDIEMVMPLDECSHESFRHWYLPGIQDELGGGKSLLALGASRDTFLLLHPKIRIVLLRAANKRRDSGFSDAMHRNIFAGNRSYRVSNFLPAEPSCCSGF